MNVCGNEMQHTLNCAPRVSNTRPKAVRPGCLILDQSRVYMGPKERDILVRLMRCLTLFWHLN